MGPVIAIVPAGVLARIRAGAPHGAEVLPTVVSEVGAYLKRALGGTLVVDPDGWHLEALQHLADKCDRHGVRLVVYGELGPVVCRQVGAVAKVTVPEVVLRGTDDSLPALRVALDRREASVPALVVQRLAHRLILLHPPLGGLTLALYAWAPLPESVALFASQVGATETAMRTWYRKVGLRLPARC